MNNLESAKKPKTSAEILAELANDEYLIVRRCAASNPNTSAEILAELANDEDWIVRSNAASNPNTPKKQ